MEDLCLIWLQLWGSLLPTTAWVAETWGKVTRMIAPIGSFSNLNVRK